MAKLKMQKIELIALLEDSKSIVDLLQRRGVVELSESEPYNDMQQLQTGSCVSMFDRFLQTAVNAQEILAKYAPRKKSLLDSFSARKEISVSDFADMVDKTDEILGICSDIIGYQKDIDESNAQIVRTKALYDALEPWEKFDLPLKLNKTAAVSVFTGSLPKQLDHSQVLSMIAENAPQAQEVEVEIISSDKIQTCVAVYAHMSCADEVEQALRLMGLNRPPEVCACTPSEQLEKYKAIMSACEKQIDSDRQEITKLGSIHSDIEFLIDYLTIRKEKYDALSSLTVSESCFVLSGFIPEYAAQKLKDEIEREFSAVVTVTEVPEGEESPTLLKNNSFVAPVESITEMYSTPSNADVDPNPVMAFFYYALFGLMLSDAGYGVVMVIAMLVAKKVLKLEEKMKKTVNMFLYCGISTIFWGTMFGSWFGDIIPVIYENFLDKPRPRMAVWLDPIEEPMMLLLYCFLFGIIHLFAGLAVRFYQLWKSGKRLDAICDTVFVYLLIAGIAPIGANIVSPMPSAVMNIGKYLAVVGAVGVVLTSGRSAKNIVGKLGGGLYGLYNTASGYLGDILSYSRLLALGLSTGVIAQVFNMLGTLPSNKIAKAIALTLVFIVGHTVNIAINLIGTYVHTNRLQYVEFFAKFYEGGGRSFTPLAANTKYYKFKEETNNG